MFMAEISESEVLSESLRRAMKVVQFPAEAAERGLTHSHKIFLR
jgi:hypothetical protein